MDNAFAWLSNLIEWFGQLIPRWVLIDPTERGIKFVWGSRVVIVEPGIVWYWPAVTRFMVHPVVRQSNNLKTQTITLKDGKTAAVGGMCVFEIKDIEAAFVHTYDTDETIRDITLSAIHDVCCILTWEEMTEQQRTGELDRKLKAEARKELERYGVRVLKMTLTDLAPVRVLKIVQATTTD